MYVGLLTPRTVSVLQGLTQVSNPTLLCIFSPKDIFVNNEDNKNYEVAFDYEVIMACIKKQSCYWSKSGRTYSSLECRFLLHEVYSNLEYSSL